MQPAHHRGQGNFGRGGFLPPYVNLTNRGKPGFIGGAAPGGAAICLVAVDEPVRERVLAKVRSLPLVAQATPLTFILRVFSDWGLGLSGSSCFSRLMPFPRVTRFSSRSAQGRRMMGSGRCSVSICLATFGASLSSGSGLSTRSLRPSSRRERRRLRLKTAEPVERRVGTKGDADQQSTRRAQDRESVSQALDRIRQAAKRRKKEKFTTLYHHLNIPMLRAAFFALKREAAPGVDGLTWRDYEADLDRRIEDLYARVQRGAYRAQPSRRRYIPKADGRHCPLAVAVLEDKIVQRATVAVLSAIYEEDFLGFSYGFRPRRSQHDALDALAVGITGTKVNYRLDADIRW